MPLAMWHVVLIPLTTSLAAALPVAALFLLFRPAAPVRIGRWRFQGLLPATRPRLTRLVWAAARKEIAGGGVGQSLSSPEMAGQVSEMLVNALREELEAVWESAPGLVRGILRDRLGPVILHRTEDVLRRKYSGVVQELLDKVAGDDILDRAVPEAVERFLAEDLEPEAWRALKSLLPALFAAAAAVGLIIGLLQALLFVLVLAS